MKKGLIEDKNIYLRKVVLEDATETYRKWINDPEVVRYTESRFSTVTLGDIKNYIEKELKKADCVFMAIVLKEKNKHIGNIKVFNIDKIHKHATLSLIIGEKSYWGRGIATKAIKLMTLYAFNALNLHKLYAGAYVDNIGSIKAFKKSGYQEEGILKKHCFFEGKYTDVVSLGIINKG